MTAATTWQDEVRRLAARAGRGDPRAQLPGRRDPGRRRPRRRLARAVADRRRDRRLDDRVLRRALHGRDGQAAEPGQDRAHPDRTRPGCSLADTIDADQLRAWKAEHPGAAVVAYVNTTAAVKAEADICCTSSNAVEVVDSIPADSPSCSCPTSSSARTCAARPGATTSRSGSGECHVHAGITPRDVRRQVAAHPDAELLIHPECGCASSAIWLAGEGELPADRTHILSTGGDGRRGTHDRRRRPRSSRPRSACCISCARSTTTPTSCR